MVTPDLVQYVEKRLERGMSFEEVRKVLEKRGWTRPDIEQALQEASSTKTMELLGFASAVRQNDTRTLLIWAFRIGFAGVFLVNSITALVDPSGFTRLMQNSLMGGFIQDFTPFVRLIAVNDFALGLLVLSGLWQKYVLAWSGLWLLAVTLIKLSTLIR